jgi:hypothetical protein
MHLTEETSVTLPRMTGPAGALQKIEQGLGSIVAAVAALLVIAEIVVLFSGFPRATCFTDRSSGRMNSPASSSCGWPCSAR